MYIGDLHIHSRYSRATSKEGTPECLDLWARRKGIQLVGTGDFTHPAWREELTEKLEPAQQGLYKLKPAYEIADKGTAGVQTRFVISGEISSIYKKNGKVRKVHNVILLPGLEAAEQLSRRLEAIGNIHSDGRPILGLDCRDLLELTLETCKEAIFIPAHIWTPHFSLFGAFSGFDTIEECFEDLTPYIHALETGLSSDPPMNWRLSALDRFQLISNSDAHSPAKLGREANLLDIDMSYGGLYRAIQKGEGLAGTIEFFPEEGKYHYDGHRKCHLCLPPAKAEQYGGKCPICGKKLTLGVSHRVEQLADRKEGATGETARPFESLVPLHEVIAASTGRSAASAQTAATYMSMLHTLGTEFDILRHVPPEDIKMHYGDRLAEGIRRLRSGRVKRNPGFDGEYGTIELFSREELQETEGQISLFGLLGIQDTAENKADAQYKPAIGQKPDHDSMEDVKKDSEKLKPEALNERQKEAVEAVGRTIAVIAGPGTGKTKTLISRIINLLMERKVKPSEITAVTFTKKAAAEMEERLLQKTGMKRLVNQIQIGTFHSICYTMLKEAGAEFELADASAAFGLARDVIEQYGLKISPAKFLSAVSAQKTEVHQDSYADPDLDRAVMAYCARLEQKRLYDFDDLLIKTKELLMREAKSEFRKQHFNYLFVDEFQDINRLQYELILAFNASGRELFVIGDPDQSIYGFRGSDAACFDRLKADRPDLIRIQLVYNYRSAPSIVKGAAAAICQNGAFERALLPVSRSDSPIRFMTAESELSEAIFIAKEVNRLIGGIDMLDTQQHLDSGLEGRFRSFSDIAVLYRTYRQARLIEECLGKEGIPYIVAGRESWLEADTVLGCISFFEYLIDNENKPALELSNKLLWQAGENKITGILFDALKEQFEPLVRKQQPYKLIKLWAEKTGLEKDKALNRLMNTALFYKRMPQFIEALQFGVESDIQRFAGKSYNGDAVTLMTLHGAKGLEFPVVFLYGVKKGVIPLENAGGETDIEEERRLFYVGMTRAKETLILTASKEASGFIRDIPESLLKSERAGSPKKEKPMKQMSLFDFMNES